MGTMGGDYLKQKRQMQSKMIKPSTIDELKARKGMLVVTIGGASLQIYMQVSYLL